MSEMNNEQDKQRMLDDGSPVHESGARVSPEPFSPDEREGQLGRRRWAAECARADAAEERAERAEERAEELRYDLTAYQARAWKAEAALDRQAETFVKIRNMIDDTIESGKANDNEMAIFEIVCQALNSQLSL